jgi:hypothetical protein
MTTPAANGASTTHTPTPARADGQPVLPPTDATPGPAWKTPLSMVWHVGAEQADRPAEEMSITWGPTTQVLAVGKETFVHDGQPTTLSSSGVARLLLAASAPTVPWRPVGETDDVRRAEFNTAIVEMLLDMVLFWKTDGMPAEHIAPQIAESSEWLVTAPSMGSFPGRARDAVAQLLSAIDDAALVRLAPIFFERRKVDRRGYDPDATVTFKIRTDKSFEGAAEMQAQLGAQLRQLRAMATAPRTPADLTVDELVLRAFGQPNEAVAAAARDEMIGRLRRTEALGPQPTGQMLQQLADMLRLVTDLYYLAKPACIVCALPATRFLAAGHGSGHGYWCDGHSGPGAPPPSSHARDLPAAAILRGAAFIARQSAQMAGVPPAPGSAPGPR